MQTTTQTTAPRHDADAAPVRSAEVFTLNRPRARDFGVGYGASSGYAAGRRYVGREWGQARFRCA